MRAYLLGTSLTALLIGLAPAAQAQNRDTGDIRDSEIIVTAQKRAENVQDVPISITVVSADQLARRGVQSVQDLSQASASIEFTAPAAAPGGGGFVRGIGTNQIGNATSASSVSIVLDGIVLGNANISDIFDTERVEVLKGPQGTLFGSSVSAGVLNITTRAPQIGELSAFLNGEIGIKPIGSEYFRGAVRGGVNIPVSDTSALRLAGYMFNNNGISRDLSNGRQQDTTNFGFRGRYLFDVGDDVTVNLIVDYNKSTNKYGGGLLYRAATPGSLLAQALAACGITPSPDNVDNCAGFPNSARQQIGGISGQVDWKLGATTLTSLTSYRKTSQKSVSSVIGIAPNFARTYLQNCDFVNCSPVVSLTSGSVDDPERTRRSLFTQELRLASETNLPLEWVGGLYFQSATFSNHKPSQLVAHPAFLGFDVVLGNAIGETTSTAKDYAVFGNATYRLSPAARLILGARYTHSDVSETISDPINSGVSDYFSAKASADALTWRAGVQYDLSDATMAYFTVSTGYKAPQINDALTRTDRVLDAIDAERPTSFEIGIKQSLFDRKLYFNADLFYTRVKDFQTQSCVSAPTGILCSNVNVPKVISKGAEWELFGHPFQGNTINISGIYNLAKYPRNFVGADGSALEGKQLNYAPKFKMTISVEQEAPLTGDVSAFVGGDATIRSRQSMYLSADPIFTVPSQTLFNARVGLRGGEGWTLALFGRNLTNKIYPTQIYPTTAFAKGGLWQILDPNSQRTVGLQFDARF
ncbi:hypothetical protein DM806_09025 [Sphingobium lactosutens]|uniref:TonB-dependent receptor n=1 Tax=Sphingobium lactosutens TaxID=522773 RepID=UPI0015BD7DAF|nr:TonB-dependent receptor [Sphingobium lactosutens]NWK95815.1 hypothetical protein [Sphingobium lactosutens]